MFSVFHIKSSFHFLLCEILDRVCLTCLYPLMGQRPEVKGWAQREGNLVSPLSSSSLFVNDLKKYLLGMRGNQMWNLQRKKYKILSLKMFCTKNRGPITLYNNSELRYLPVFLMDACSADFRDLVLSLSHFFFISNKEHKCQQA